MADEDYLSLVTNQIEIDKLLHSISPNKREYAKKLLEKKKEIIKKNGFFADFQLKRINKKIERLKKH